jgi:hypothetical protein
MSESRQRRVIAAINAGECKALIWDEQSVHEDTDWHVPLRLDNIGRKTIDEMVRLGLLERESPDSYWVRLRSPDADEFSGDFGDLWVPAA